MGSQRKRNMPMMCNDIKSKTFRRKQITLLFRNTYISMLFKYKLKNKVLNIFVTISSSTEKSKQMQILF